MNLVGRSLALGWMTTILVVQVSVARHSRWALNAKTQALWDLSPQELECVHNFLVNRRELELQSSKVLTLAKNSVFLIEMLKPKKYEVLDFLDNGAMPPVREARVLIYFGAQEYPNVTEYAVGPVEQPMYMRKLSRKGGQELSWASRPMSKVESVLLFHTLKTATEPLQEFFFDITGFTLQDCNGGCLTFTNIAPRAMAFRKRWSWFLLQRLVNGYFLQPTGLEILGDHGSKDVQDWRVEQLWYNATFLDAIHYYDSDGPVLYQRALCIFEEPKGVPLRRHFNSNFRNSFSSHARLNGPMLVLRTTSTIHNHDYIWDFIFHPNGVTEGKMYATDYVHATFYTSGGLVHSTHLHSHLLGNVHSHLAHYRIDLDVAGTKNRFQTLRMRVENITSPWTRRSQQVKPILDKTQHFWERQAAFHFRQTLPKYLLFSNTGKSVLGHSRSYRLQIPSVAEQMLPQAGRAHQLSHGPGTSWR